MSESKEDPFRAIIDANWEDEPAIPEQDSWFDEDEGVSRLLYSSAVHKSVLWQWRMISGVRYMDRDNRVSSCVRIPLKPRLITLNFDPEDYRQ